MTTLPEKNSVEELEFRLAAMEAQVARLKAGQVASRRADLQAKKDQEIASLHELVARREGTIASMSATRVWRTGLAFWHFRRRAVARLRMLANRFLPSRAPRPAEQALPAGVTAPTPATGPGASSTTAATAQPAAEKQKVGAPHRGYDVIYLPVIEWSIRAQRPQQMAIQFAAHGHRVFYVNPIRTLPALSAAERSHTLAPIAANIYDTTLASTRRPMLYRNPPDGPMLQQMVNSLEHLRREHSIGDAVCIVQFPFWTKVALELRRRFGWRIIYDCMDDWRSVQGVEWAALQHEDELVRSCDALVVPNRRLLARWAGTNPRAFVVRNGVDMELYTTGYRPNEIIKDVAHPLIGYSGAMTSWFDADLLAQVAASRPQWTFALLGNIVGADVAPLQALPNVRLLGSQPPASVPAYLYHFDVCILPYQINDTTATIDPLNFYEYMSTGKPVVSTRLPELARHEGYLYFADNAQEFAAQLDVALAESNLPLVQRRKLLAEMHSWTGRYQEMDSIIHSIYPPVTIVLVAHNNAPLARRCIERIYAGDTYPSFDVVVVDDASTDVTRTYLDYASAALPRLRVIHNTAHQGPAAARQTGAAAAQGEGVVFLGLDVTATPGWLGRLMSHLQDDSTGLVGAVSNIAGQRATVSGDYQDMGQMQAFAWRHLVANDQRVSEVVALDPFCLALRREVLDQVGPWPAAAREGEWLARRVRESGRRVLLAHDVFLHRGGFAAGKGHA